MDELDDGPACLNDLESTWRFDMDHFWRSALSRHLPPVMTVTGQPTRWIRLKGA